MKITENDFLKQVIDLAKLCGWRIYHARPAMNQRGRWLTPMQGDTGFPDLVMVHALMSRIIFAELKSETGKLSESQKEWIYQLGQAGQVIYVWRPSDWDEIVEILR